MLFLSLPLVVSVVYESYCLVLKFCTLRSEGSALGMKFFSILWPLALAGAVPHYIEVNEEIEATTDDLQISIPTPTIPRSALRPFIYVQIFTTPDKPLLLLPHLKYETKVTHVILVSTHLNEKPGFISLNDDPFEAPAYDSIWQEVKTLQENGIKVMALLGGAANRTYTRLNGTDREVGSH